MTQKEQFLLFPQCFLLNQKIVSPFVNIFDIISLFAAKLEAPKIGMWDKELTHYQTTNFRLFQTKRICRRQFQIWRKWQKVIQKGRKHCGKWRNCSLWAISPFPTVFSKGLFPRGGKRFYCVGMGWIIDLWLYPKEPHVFTCLQYKSSENSDEQYLLFTQPFLPFQRPFHHFHQI